MVDGCFIADSFASNFDGDLYKVDRIEPKIGELTI